jgi:TM2 domain-containing membrane protein YozV
MKSKLVAAALAFFLGSLGIHKFYLKDSGTGIFYLILSVLGIRLFAMPVSGILGVIDGIMLLSMSDEQFDKKYNKNVTEAERTQYKRRSYPKQRASNRSSSRERRYEPPGTPRKTQTRRKRKKVVRDNPFKRSGVKKYKDFELEEAIVDFQKGLELEPDDISLHFNLACAYSLTEQPDKSYYHLSRAVSNGFKDFEKIKTHDDLAYLRIHKDFESFKKNGYQIKKDIPVSDVEVKENHVPEKKEPVVIDETNPLDDDILLSQLNKLNELRKKGLISDREFQMEKRKLLRD